MDDDDYPFAVHVQPANCTGYCTGVLISPAFVLTANHCITGEQPGCIPVLEPSCAGGNGSYTITFDSVPSGAVPAGAIRQHTQARSGSPMVRINGPVDSCSEDASAMDVALLQLDTRMSIDQVEPLHVPKPGEAGCRFLVDPSSFSGRLVGYGRVNMWDDSPPPAFRNVQFSDGWSLADEAGGDRYTNSWFIVPDGGFSQLWYNGIIGGDSGGPLISISSNLLCGVSSRYYPLPLVMASDVAAIDSVETLSFLHANILDAKGRFKGECDEGPVVGRDTDNDKDLIPDSCDPCPNVPARDATGRNTYDHSVDPDTDGDGVPNTCDNCPLKFNPHITFLHVQPDGDGDGVGDDCDSCDGALLPSKDCCTTDADCGSDNACVLGPGSPILSFPICSVGRCAKPIDGDQDGTGDSCDNCPPDPQGNFGESNPNQADTDMDNVGDACDNCPGLPNETHVEDENPPCGTGGEAFCKSLFFESVCVPPDFLNGLPTVARCSKGIDFPDGDGVGNACDNCPNRTNPFEGLGFQPNCNRDVEVLLNNPPYPFAGEGDACDKDPCAELGFSYAPIGLTPPPLGLDLARRNLSFSGSK